jgi:hypothetical protein
MRLPLWATFWSALGIGIVSLAAYFVRLGAPFGEPGFFFDIPWAFICVPAAYIFHFLGVTHLPDVMSNPQDYFWWSLLVILTNALIGGVVAFLFTTIFRLFRRSYQ